MKENHGGQGSKKRRYLYLVLPVIGVLFGLWYVKAATYDIVYTDYIRLVNEYLPDVWNPDKFFVPDVLTRVPLNYLGRIINTTFFDYSTSFDMALGVLGLGIGGAAFAVYSSRVNLRWYWFVPVMVLWFGLNKWEMLTNGTGWVHFWAIGGFCCHYVILDRIWYGTGMKWDRKLLMILPFVLTLGVAGPYCAIYTVVMVLAYGFCMVCQWMRTKEMDRRYLRYMICVLLPFALYLWSNAFAVEEHTGMQELPLFGTLFQNPGYFVHFFLKSLAGDVVGGELLETWIRNGQISGSMVYVTGIVVFAAALWAVWVNFRYHICQKTLLPLLCLVTGGLNHLLILYSRWSFMNENYGMSSRYALQFQFLTTGILLTAALSWDQIAKKVTGFVLAASCLALIAGSCVTTWHEAVVMAPHREAYGENIASVALRFQEATDDELRETFDFRKSREDSGAKVRQALEILYEQRWNVFRQVP